MTRILDRGTMDPDVKVDVNSDPASPITIHCSL